MAQYIILPRTELKASSGRAVDLLTRLPYASSMEPRRKAVIEMDTGPATNMDIIDTTAEDGPKLVEMDSETAQSLNDRSPHLRAVPLVQYAKPSPHLQANRGNSALSTVTIEITDAVSGAGIEGVYVVAFTNFTTKSGDGGKTDRNGQVQLQLNGTNIDRLYAYPVPNYWGGFYANLPIQSNIGIKLEPVTLPYTDSVRYYYNATQFTNSTGVKVGVIDTGVGPHPDISLVYGTNTVTGENANDYEDWDNHGTHVAGLIGANGLNGLRGLAPGVEIHAYRVFGRNADHATNYAILKAMMKAAWDGCDIINLSLGGGPADTIVEEAIRDARNQGMLVVIAAGNDDRGNVNYPAAYPGATAISAMGREGTYPPNSLSEGDVLRPPHGNDSKEFIGSFSNIGSQIAVTAPGVGTLSTLPNGHYGPMSGTSMAAPVAAGAAACLLSNDMNIYQLNRDRGRSNAIEQLLQSNCDKRGFGLQYEGYGMPDPTVI
ncbi:MAG: S8 family serine peptidase [Cyclobacteriaceae bacterium]